ncbi:MAG: proton-conducting transporter membrane subunit, partial [Pseudomonadota bacterium]
MIDAAPTTLMVAAMVIPLLGAIGILVFGESQRNMREAVTLLTAGITFFVVLSLLGQVLEGARPILTVLTLEAGLSFRFAVEPLGMLFAVIASGLWIVNSIYSIGYMRSNKEPRQTTFYICFAIAISSTLGIAFAGNLVTLFLFYEILTLSTYPLVTHKGDATAIAGGRVYILVLLGTSMILLLPAVIWTYVIAGTTYFTDGGILAGKTSAAVTGVLLALFVFGIGKAALMPGHFWLPSAMVAPTQSLSRSRDFAQSAMS